MILPPTEFQFKYVCSPCLRYFAVSILNCESMCFTHSVLVLNYERKYLPEVGIRWRLFVDTYSTVSQLGPFSRETAVQGFGLQEHSTFLQGCFFEV